METSYKRAWYLPPLGVDQDALKPTTEQQHLFDDFEPFKLSATHDGFDIQVVVQVHKSICSGRFRCECYMITFWMGGGLVCIVLFNVATY